jgi:hypothetical protein
MKANTSRNVGVARTSATAANYYYGTTSQNHQKSVSGMSSSHGGAPTTTITPTGYSSNATHKTGISSNFQTKAAYIADPGYTHQQT